MPTWSCFRKKRFARGLVSNRSDPAVIEMSEIAISVDNLSKSYRITHQANALTRYRTLREDILDAPRRLWSRLRRNGSASSETFWALKDVSFEIKQGDVIGIIGRNGAGKSTLLKILSRITDPTSGEAKVYGRVGSLLEVGTGFHAELTGRENIFLNGAILGMRRGEIRAKFDEIVAFAEVEKFLDTPVKHYSSGMYVRLAFAVAAHLEPEILLVDEVLAVGDAEFQKKCLGKMKDVGRSGRTVMFVSHNMGAVTQLCGRAILLDRGRIEKDGEVEAVIRHYVTRNTTHSAVVDLRDFPGRQGTGAVRFQAARLLNGAGETCSEYCMGDDLEIEFEIRFHQPVRSITMAVELLASDGLKLAHMVDFDSGFTIAEPRDEEVVRVRLHDVRFFPGTYSIGLFVGDSRGVESYDWVPNCLNFNVIGGGRLTSRPLPRAAGIIFLTPEWQRCQIRDRQSAM
jgi:lipopolysaccharide transport system ATP-binding protein